MPVKTGSQLSLFSFLTNILRLKSRSVYDTHVSSEEFDSLYIPFMVTKWCSMLNDENVAEAIARHQEALDFVMDDPRTHYRLLIEVLPKTNITPKWIFKKTA